MRNNEYQGFSNYPTWCYHLHLTNENYLKMFIDAEIYKIAKTNMHHEYIEEDCLFNEMPNYQENKTKYGICLPCTLNEVEDFLKDFLENDLLIMDTLVNEIPSIAQDLLEYTLKIINYRELADLYLMSLIEEKGVFEDDYK